MRLVAALWGIIGVAALLAFAVFRLFPYVIDSMHAEWAWYHWATLVVTVIVMAYSEGYRGFQKGFSPRVAARARHLHHAPSHPVHKLLSPFFVTGYFHAPLRRRITSFAVTFTIILLVISVRHLDQPWRGIVDAGVCVGLIWGIVSVLWMGYQALTSTEFNVNPELPDRRQTT